MTIRGNAGTGAAENLMSGTVRVTANASQSAGASGHRGRLAVQGDAGADLGDPIREARISVRSRVASPEADCIEEPMHDGPRATRRSSTITRCPGSAAPRPPASTTSAAAAPGGGCRLSAPACSPGASVSRDPLDGCRERCDTDGILGDRFAGKPVHLTIPATIAGMSLGPLSAPAREAPGRSAPAIGTSTATGEGGMTDEERGQSSLLVCQVLPSRHGLNPDDLRRADAIEMVVGRGAKPGSGGMMPGRTVSERVAGLRTLPQGVDRRSARRHPDRAGPDDRALRIRELRGIAAREKPVHVKVGAVAALRQAVEALRDLDMHRKLQLVVSGAIRTVADEAKALAMGADAVSIGTAAPVAPDNDPAREAEDNAPGPTAGAHDDWHEGRDPAGITTRDLGACRPAGPGEGRPAAAQ